MLRISKNGRGFTIIELLVVVTIVVILMALLLPSLKKAQDLAKRAKCAANQRAIAQAVRFYASDNDDYAVPQFVNRANPDPTLNWPGPLGYPNWADEFWMNGIALGQYFGNLLDEGNNPTVWIFCKSKTVLNCPADQEHPLNNTSYAMSTAEYAWVVPSAPPYNPWNPMWKLAASPNQSIQMVVVDSTIERLGPGPFFYGNPDPELNGNWNGGQPDSLYNWAKRHQDGANVSFLDGHVEFLLDLKTARDQGQLNVTNPQTGQQ